MTSKQAPEDMELLDRSPYEASNELNECIEQIHSEPMEPPPPYEAVIQASNAGNQPKARKQINKYYALGLQISTIAIGILEFILIFGLLYTIFMEYYVLPSSVNTYLVVILSTSSLMMGTCLFLSNFQKTTKYHIVYLVLGVMRSVGAFVYAMSFSSDFKEIDKKKKSLDDDLEGAKNWLYTLDSNKSIYEMQVSTANTLKKFNINGREEPEYSKVFRENSETKLADTIREISETQTRINTLTQQLQTATSDEATLRNFVILLVAICTISAIFLLIIYQAYRIKKRQLQEEYAQISKDDHPVDNHQIV